MLLECTLARHKQFKFIIPHIFLSNFKNIFHMICESLIVRLVWHSITKLYIHLFIKTIEKEKNGVEANQQAGQFLNVQTATIFLTPNMCPKKCETSLKIIQHFPHFAAKWECPRCCEIFYYSLKYIWNAIGLSFTAVYLSTFLGPRLFGKSF